MTVETSEKSKDILRHLEGRICIYQETYVARRVRVSKVDLSEWGATFIVEVVPTPELIDDQPVPRSFNSTLDFSASWDVIHVSEAKVAATWVSWMLIIREDLVKQIVGEALGMTREDLLDFMNTLASGGERR